VLPAISGQSIRGSFRQQGVVGLWHELRSPISTSRDNFQSIVLVTSHSSHHARWSALFSCARIDEVQQGAEITNIVRIRQVQVKVFLSEKLLFVHTFVEAMYVSEVLDAGLQTHI
jgi:hypothetical protein